MEPDHTIILQFRNPLQLVAYLTVFARLFMMSETLSLKGKVLTRIMQLYWIVSPK